MNKLPIGVTETATGRFQARVCRNNQILHVGVYDTPQEASDARSVFLSRAINPAATAPEPTQPVQLPTGSPREVLQEEPAPLPTAVPPPLAATAPQGCVSCGRSLRNGDRCAAFPACPCCPRCGSNLYGEVGGGYLCRACGAQPVIVVPPGISRAQYGDAEWRRAHIQKGMVMV